jgi:hypothetical protein
MFKSRKQHGLGKSLKMRNEAREIEKKIEDEK